MWYIQEDKSKWIKEDYIPNWKDDISQTKVSFDIIPWVNAPQLESSTSINWATTTDIAQNEAIEDLESRVGSLENS